MINCNVVFRSWFLLLVWPKKKNRPVPVMSFYGEHLQSLEECFMKFRIWTGDAGLQGNTNNDLEDGGKDVHQPETEKKRTQSSCTMFCVLWY